jgi:hypothetical protein
LKSFCLSRHSHGSKSEALDCDRLLSDKQNGRIRDYKVWPSIALHIDGKTWKRWKIDFLVFELDGSEPLFESKGWNKSDDNCLLKLSAYLTEYPERPIYVGWENFRIRRRAELSPGLRVLYSGIKKRKPRRQAFKTWDRGSGKYVPLKLDHKRNASDRQQRD